MVWLWVDTYCTFYKKKSSDVWKKCKLDLRQQHNKIWWRYDVILGMFCFTRLCRRQWCADYYQQNNLLYMIYTHTTILTFPLPLPPILHQSYYCCVNMWSLFMVISSKWWGFLCKIPFYHCRSAGCCEGAALDSVWLLFPSNMTFQFVCCTNSGRTLSSPYQPTHTLCCCHLLIRLHIPCINVVCLHIVCFSSVEWKEEVTLSNI